MILLGILSSATLGWLFGYLYATQSIKTTIIRSYNVTVSNVKPLRVIK